MNCCLSLFKIPSFGAYMKILYRSTDPGVKDGAFMSAIFTLN